MSENNPWTGRPYTQEYYNIKAQREKLPVYRFREMAVQTISSNKVTIIEGATGSGKTTQIPQFLLEANITAPNQRIVCSQPRRVAAQNVARRVADEMDVKVGETVGYVVRFDSKMQENTRLIYMTEGLLLREFVQDPLLSKWGVVIIDEAHERTTNTDIIIGFLKQLIERRNDLHVVIMSATLEATKFTEFFQGAPHLEVPGKLFKVEIHYLDEAVGSYVDAAVSKVCEIHEQCPPGDILLFLTGEEEIETSCGRIRDKISAKRAQRGISEPDCIVLPLYAALIQSEQNKVFMPAPPGKRKIIVSTNIAETSVTIDGVVYVVDSGFVKLSQYDPSRRMSRLVVTQISKAAANQRAGRAGRTQAGHCYRLYSEVAFNEILRDQTIPEIQRTELSQVILTMLAVGVKDIVNFPFLDKPPSRQLLSAVEELYHLGAITIEGQMTEVGKKISVCPIDPKYARALISSGDYGCTDEMCAMVALLSEAGQLFVRPAKEGPKADKAHEQFRSQTGDHIRYLNVYEAYRKCKGMGERESWCRRNYINFRFIERMDKNYHQLTSLVERLGIRRCSLPKDSPNRESTILRALLCGLFMQIARRKENTSFFGFLQNTREAEIHQSSSVRADSAATWVVYSAHVYTKSDYLRDVSVISPEWVFEAAPTYFDPKFFADSAMKDDLFALHRRLVKQ